MKSKVFFSTLIFVFFLANLSFSQEKETTEKKFYWINVETFKPEKWAEYKDTWKNKVLPALDGTEFSEFQAYTSVVSKRYTITWVVEASNLSEFFDFKGPNMGELIEKKYGKEEAAKIWKIMDDAVVESYDMILELDSGLSFIKNK